MVDLSRRNAVTRFQIGRLVCLAFHGEPPSSRHEACHRNGRPAENLPGNLYWGTRVENMSDAQRHGPVARGVKHGQAKLTDDAVMRMLNKRAEGATYKALSAEFGVSASNCHAAVCGAQWAHIDARSAIAADVKAAPIASLLG